MLRITAVSPGAVDYLLRGSGCAEHEHAGEASEKGPDRSADAVGYLLAGAGKEPAGVWGGAGLSMLGVQLGAAATEAQVRAVFGRLEHPNRIDPKTGAASALGSRPRNFSSRDERVARALAAEPDATEERRAEIRQQAYAQRRKAVAYYDLTFSPAKSVSVYWAAALRERRDADAANVVAAHRAGVAAAMAYVELQAGYVRSGYHGKTASGQSVGVYEQARGLAWIRWDHSTSRAQQPQLHSHVTVLNRAETASDGVVRALASRGFKPIKQAAEAIYTKVSQETLAATNRDVVFAMRPDGKGREILGFAPQLLAKASSRSLDIAARRGELVERFVQANGRAPSPVETRRLHRDAWRETRQPKNHAVSPRRQLDNWAEPLQDELTAALTAAAAARARIDRDGHPEHHGHESRSREQVLGAAVRSVQLRYATWDIGNLTAAIADEQVRTPSVVERPQDLAAEVLRDADRYGVVMVSVRDVGTVPAELCRRDGLNRFRMRNAEEYATTAQLATEARIVARARTVGAAALSGPALERAGVELRGAGLGDDQRDKVLQILSSGRSGDILIGPAGVGKSRTVGALARVWEQQIGGRVWGVATSQAATQVLAEDGLTALNSTRFLLRFDPDDRGRAHDRLRRGDLVVVDEAGMSSTEELDRISAVAAAGGAKLLYTGDPEQLAAVGAGGMLGLLVRDVGAQVLTEVHRFSHAWQRAASIRLRVGDPEVLAVYDAHGRIRGGTEQEMIEAAVRGYLADVLQGFRSLLVARAEATARELSAHVRAELVAAGRVSAVSVAEARDGNPVGVGDRIQARRNDYTLRFDGGRPVVNREVYQVVGYDRGADTLTVRALDGEGDGVVARLPAGYVRRHATLAYALTSYGAQGITVDTSHSLVDPGTTRAGVYVPGSRGRDANTFYVVCRHAPDHHDPERIDATPVAVLTDILTRPTDRAAAAAEIARRAGNDDTRSLAWVGTQWDLLTADHLRRRATDTLDRLLPADLVARVVGEPGYPRLISAVRSMELAGHDPHAVLTEAVARGSLHDAASVSDVLRYRVRLHEAGGRTPERTIRDGDWTTFTAPWAGPVGDYAQTLAAAATARQTELGERVAAHPPAWALAVPTLGPPPADPGQHAEWVRRAGIVAAYRDLHAIPDDQPSLGEAPSRERALHHALWRQAVTALGHPADVLDYATATDAELREMRGAWHRAQAWAPPYVADELREQRLQAEECRRDAVIWRAGLERHPAGSADRALDERDVAYVEHLAAVHAGRVDALERIHTARADWFDRHRDLQQRAAFAGDELERRGLDRDTTTPVGEQQELFTAAHRDLGSQTDTSVDTSVDTDAGSIPASAPTTAATDEHDLDPVPRQLDLDDVPCAVSVIESTPHEDAAHPTGRQPARPPVDGSGTAAAAQTEEEPTEEDVAAGAAWAARQADVIADMRAKLASIAVADHARGSQPATDDSDDEDQHYGVRSSRYEDIDDGYDVDQGQVRGEGLSY